MWVGHGGGGCRGGLWGGDQDRSVWACGDGGAEFGAWGVVSWFGELRVGRGEGRGWGFF